MRYSRADVTVLAVNLTVAMLLLATPLFLQSGCVGDRELDPAGPYEGDRVLWELDGLIEETERIFDTVIALADRNPVAMQQNPQLRERVDRIRAELDGIPRPEETLVKLFAVRDAYRAARGSAAVQEDARQAIRTARTAHSTAPCVTAAP